MTVPPESHKKSITLISLNFYPEDTAIGLYSTQWIEHLREAGYEVNVLTAFPYYPQWEIWPAYRDRKTYLKEHYKGITVYRYKQYVPKTPTISKRIFHLLDFTWGTFINSFKIKKSDLVIAVVPFTTSVYLGWLLKWRLGAKLWVHIQDFEFDAVTQTGVSSGPSWPKRFAFNILNVLESWGYNRADKVSTISHRMLGKLSLRLAQHGARKQKKTPYLLPNWIDITPYLKENVTAHPYLSSGKLKMLYAGNIGHKQDWELFVALAKALDAKRYELIVVGDGAMKAWLVNATGTMDHVIHHDPVPFFELPQLLQSADLHLLLQKEEVLDTVMPSKVLGMMASGKPSVVTGHPYSEVKIILEDAGAGTYIGNPEVDGLIGAIRHFSKLEKDSIGGYSPEKARKYIREHFGKSQILQNFTEELQRLLD